MNIAFAAEEAAPAAEQSPYAYLYNMLPLAAIVVVFYFLLIRPQQKKAKEQREMLSNIKEGDSIITNGGMHARVISVQDDTLMIEIAPNVKVKVSREAVILKKKA